MHMHTLLLLLFPVNVLSQNHPKTLYCWKKRCFFTIFLQHQGQNSSKHTAICRVFFGKCGENSVFCLVFLPRSLKCIVNTGVGFTCQTSSSQSKPAKTTGIYNVLTRQYAKNIDVLKQTFTFFSRCSSIQKWIMCSVFAIAHPVQTQEGVKSQKMPNWTYNRHFVCRNLCHKVLGRLSKAQKCYKFQCITKVPCISPAKKRPSPAS